MLIDLSNVWPEWKAIEQIGEGSFGKVYKCVRDDYGITMLSAVKVVSIPQNDAEVSSLRFEGMNEAEARSYFEGIVNDFANEIKMMVLLRNAPNIVPVENYKIVERTGSIGWDIYIRMDYLTSFVQHSVNHRLDESGVKKFGLDICNALEVCAQKGIIHRDIKPDNIFIDEYGSYRLGDFGVARKLENTVSAMSKKGTYSYMAPEVFKGEKYDNRADIYSLGMVMYKLLNNNRDPFVDPAKSFIGYKDKNDAIERRWRGEKLPAPINASPEMAAVILKACEFSPENRYATVSQFKAAIEAVRFGEEPTVTAEDYFEKTVAARDFEIQAAYANAEEPTVLADDEPTVFDGRDEATVLAVDEPTVIDRNEEETVVIGSGNRKTVAEKDKTKFRSIVEDTKENLRSEEDEEEDDESPKSTFFASEQNKKALIISAVVLAIVAVLLLFLAFLGIKAKNSPDTETTVNASNYYSQAEEAYNSGDIKNAAILFGKAGDYSDARERSFALWDEIAVRETVAASSFTVGLKFDGTVVAVGYNGDGRCDVDEWSDIVAVSADTSHTLGLKSDGTVVAVGYNGNGVCDVDGWTDIVAVSAGGSHNVGLKADGTVVAVGYNGVVGRCDVDDWTGIVAVSAGASHTVGLKSDGTVVAVGYNKYGQCDVDGWTDIVAIKTGEYHTIGLKSNGTVVAVGDNDSGQCDVDGWSDIVAVSAGGSHTVGLKSDGTVVAVGLNSDGQCNVDGWTDIVAVSAGSSHTIGLKSDGTVVATRYIDDPDNDYDTYYGQCDIDDWTDIKLP